MESQSRRRPHVYSFYLLYYELNAYWTLLLHDNAFYLLYYELLAYLTLRLQDKALLISYFTWSFSLIERCVLYCRSTGAADGERTCSAWTSRGRVFCFTREFIYFNYGEYSRTSRCWWLACCAWLQLIFIYLFWLKAPLIEGMLRLKKKGHGMFEDPWKARAMCQVVC